MSTLSIRGAAHRLRQPLTPPPPAPSTGEDLETKPRSHSLDLGLVRWILGYTRPYARKRNLLALLAVTRSIQLPLVAWAMARVIEGPIAERSHAGLFRGVLALLAIAALTHLTYHFRQRLALELGEAVVHDLRNAIFAHLQRMQMSFYHRMPLGRIISRVTSDADAVRSGVQDVLFISLVALGQMLVAGALMAVQDGTLFLVVAAMLPVLWTIHRRFRGRMSQAYRQVQESFSRVTANVAESIQGIQVTQGAVREELNSRRFAELVDDHGRYNFDVARTTGVFLPILEFNSQFFLTALLVVGGYRALTPGVEMPLGDLIQFLFLANIFLQPVQTLGDQYNAALSAMAGAERVRALLETEPDWQDVPTTEPSAPLHGQVRFENVSFAYHPQRNVLHNVHFSVEPGQTVAVVGHTGSGKSTIINLLAKFHLPTAGRILLDGRDLRELDSQFVHRQTAIVLQQNFLFSGTVMDNIRVGRPEATDDEVLEAVEKLDCLDVLQSLPAGLHTEVGEAGARISLGQRQLVCFARAMLANPRILLLDEATSSIDVFTERRVQEALRRLLAGRTSFVVAHRLRTIRDADLVLVLDQGRIVERGDHRNLLAAGGAYANLYQQSMPLTAA